MDDLAMAVLDAVYLFQDILRKYKVGQLLEYFVCTCLLEEASLELSNQCNTLVRLSEEEGSL